MAHGFNGRILRVDLSRLTTQIEQPEENFYRRYLGGRGFISYYLLKELGPGIDPLGLENKLIFAAGVVTGAPVGGAGRNSLGAKSPLTGGYGDAEVGGYWGAELKHAGYDAIIVEGRAEKPVYLWIKDGQAEIRDARHLWGLPTKEAQKTIQEELGDPGIRVAQIGIGGENLVRYACVLNDLSHAAGRTGLGAVMGSKKLKAIAVRGHNPPPLANPEAVSNMASWLRDNFLSLTGRYHDEGTASGLWSLNRDGGLPTRNFQEGSFEGMSQINGRTLRDTILVARRSCWACPVRCKREVEVKEPYSVDPAYGGPEYEALASMGSNCSIADLKGIAKGNELCNSYGLDTISTGANIAFAMECFERGLLTPKDTGGLELSFGNTQAMLQMVEMIAKREGLGNILAEGVARAAARIGRGAESYALHVKGLEVPMHEPRFKQGLGLGYAVSPTGADHCHNLHDVLFTGKSLDLEVHKGLGILEPLALTDLGPDKVRLLIYFMNWRHVQNSLVFCQFVNLDHSQMTELVGAVTGWNSTVWELMKVGERCANLTRAFNIREGFTKEDDRLPERFLTPFTSGPLQGVALDRRKLERARNTYYAMMGWDRARGAPTPAKLQELGMGWAAGELRAKGEARKREQARTG